jgi:two-component system, sensor histidine kinase and response regulator
MPAPVKCLIVDDLPENLIALEALLRREDLEILHASSGREALELLLVHEVALAILDVQMPEMDGFELAELMRGRERTRHVPIIFVTAGPYNPSRQFAGYEAGAVDFLYKPIDPRILGHKVDTFFELYRQRQLLADQYRELQSSAEERERLIRELSSTLELAEMFTAVLGHDLRNPLNVIALSGQILVQYPKDESVRRQAELLLSSSRRMARMIEDLLDLSRARLAGGIPLSVRPLDLVELCQRVVADHQLTSPDHCIELKHQGDPRGVWDEDRLFQMMSNLLGNAIQHGQQAGEIRVRIDCQGQGQVGIEVGNGGVIPPELLPHLFNPFSVHKRSQMRSQGLGLGLYIVQQIAAAHGGEVEAESDPRDGTTFRVRLPRTTKLAVPVDAAQSAPRGRSGS